MSAQVAQTPPISTPVTISTRVDQVGMRPLIASWVRGIVAAAVVMALIISSAIATSEPRAPYGIRERVWNTYDDARRAEIATAATSDFSQVEIPFLFVFSLIPGTLVYLLSRELVGERDPSPAR
jgi:uncharacterized membrane protein